MKSKVALVRCESYDPALVAAVVNRGIELIGGIHAFAKAGERPLFRRPFPLFSYLGLLVAHINKRKERSGGRLSG